MTHYEVREVLSPLSTWRLASLAAQDAFLQAAVAIRYGNSELSNAWEWFYTGWCSK